MTTTVLDTGPAPPRTTPPRHPLLRLVDYFWPQLSGAQRRRIGYSCTLLIAMRCVSLTIPWVLGKLIAVAAERTGEILAVMIGLVAAYAALHIMRTLFNELKNILFISIVQRMMRIMSFDLLSHLHHLPLAFHLSRQTGGLAIAIERGTKSIEFLLSSALFGFLPPLLEVLAVGFIFWGLYGLPYAVAIGLTIVCYIVFTILVTKWRLKFRRRVNDANETANTRAIDSLLNHETVKIFSAEQREVERYDNTMARYEQASIVNQRTLSLLNLGQALIATVGLTATLLLASYDTSAGLLDVGALATLNAYLLQVFLPLGYLGDIYRSITRSLVDMEKIFDLLDQPSSVADDPAAQDLPPGAGQIELRNVALSLGGRAVLHDISFTVPAGKRYALVGETGSGKTSITRLLARLLDPDSGQIFIDGHNIRQLTQLSVRRALAFVPQDVVMFNDSLRMNITFGKPDATDEEIAEALTTSGLDKFVAALPDGLGTEVGERGLKLSGGERQRLAIARALLKHPRIFVLDEATSALDMPTETRIKQAMDTATANHTTLVIAHRLSTVRDCDRIFVLDSGYLVESGTHDELLKQDGLYALSWTIQSKQADRVATSAA